MLPPFAIQPRARRDRAFRLAAERSPSLLQVTKSDRTHRKKRKEAEMDRPPLRSPQRPSHRHSSYASISASQTCQSHNPAFHLPPHPFSASPALRPLTSTQSSPSANPCLLREPPSPPRISASNSALSHPLLSLRTFAPCAALRCISSSAPPCPPLPSVSSALNLSPPPPRTPRTPRLISARTPPNRARLATRATVN
jgi:hypothetical protein